MRSRSLTVRQVPRQKRHTRRPAPAPAPVVVPGQALIDSNPQGAQFLVDRKERSLVGDSVHGRQSAAGQAHHFGQQGGLFFRSAIGSCRGCQQIYFDAASGSGERVARR